MSEIGYRFETTSGAGDVARSFARLEPGGESGVNVVTAGRLMRSRPQGRLAFAELRDWTGAIQLFALAALTPNFDEFCHLSLGDWIGVSGEVVRTRRGELSVKVASWELLARARRGFGDKWHGVSDPDIRYRQRELDLWANEGVRDIFLLRSKVLASIRHRLSAAGFVEVETPVLHPIPGGATARPFVTHYNALHTDVYLRIATELYLKRCVVGGIERVFEIGRTFRNEGLSPRHNPEFTMLELVELIAEHAGVEVDTSMDVEDLRHLASGLGVPFKPWYGPGKLILEIYEKTTEAELWGPVFVCDYPQEVSPLARAHRSKPGYVERFEPIIAGRELGNAFSELTDPDDQRARFEEQERERALGDEEAMAIDWDYLRALELGLPPTGGLGLGIDRLVMLYADVANIREVLLFPALRPEDTSPGPPAGSTRSGEPDA